MLHLRILTTDQTVFSGPVDEIVLPTESGMIGVFKNHTPLVTIIRSGQMTVKYQETTTVFTVSGGVLEVRPGSQAIVLATGVKEVGQS